MSQRTVEHVIGRLATDEALRRRFVENPRAVLEEMTGMGTGMELTDCERWALASMDLRELSRFARAIDSRLQKADPRGGVS